MSSTARILLGPRLLLLHLAAVVAVVVAGALGWWQLEAWQTSREDRALELVDQDPRPLDEVLGPDDAFPAADVGRPVAVSGQWVSTPALYVTDRRRTSTGADDGVWQIALLSVCPVAECAGSATQTSVMPVVLGWAASPAAGVAAPQGRAELTGWLQPAEEGRADPDPGDTLLPALRSVDLLEQTDQDLYSGYVILREPEQPRVGLSAVTPESLPDPPASTALRNLLYGLEWWVFAGFALFLWWRWTRDAVAEARRAAQEPPVASPV